MRITDIKDLYKTEWLGISEATYIDKDGKEQKWQFVSRSKSQKTVVIICKTKTNNKILLIAQYRVPFKKIVIEFPSGLIESSETLAEAALRELKEETGYEGKILTISPEISKSAGLTTETSVIVECIVDQTVRGTKKLEPSEDIQSFWISPDQFMTMIGELDPNQYVISLNVWNFFGGIFFYKKYLKPKKK